MFNNNFYNKIKTYFLSKNKNSKKYTEHKYK